MTFLSIKPSCLLNVIVLIMSLQMLPESLLDLSPSEEFGFVLDFILNVIILFASRTLI